jgi:DNA-binding CsgD family transcriptional regulator
LHFEFLRDDVARFFDLSRRACPVALLSVETEGEPARSPRFREMLAPAGIADELRVVCRDAFGAWSTLALFSRRILTVDDRLLVERLLPTVTTAVRAAHHKPVAPQDGDDGPAVLVLDHADRVVTADDRARARFLALGGRGPAGLPGVVHVLAARSRAGHGPQRVQARVRAVDGSWWVLDAAPLDDGLPGGVAVVIQPAPRAALLDTALRSHGLTAREREVAALAVLGRSNREIAAHLHLSPWTVQDNLKSSFAKTGSRSRGELAALAVGASAAGGP